MALPSIFRIPRPQTFLYLVSLRTGTELITLTLLINKVSGFYGILALLTGYSLSGLQLSMYMYSILILGLVLYLAPYIRTQSPLQNLALAWIYILDSLVNATYTALFGLSWFMMLAQHLSPDDDDRADAPADRLPGGKMMNDTAGFTTPEYNVSHVDIIDSPGGLAGHDAVAVGSMDGGSSSGGNALGNAVFQSGSIASISVISALWAVRLYFCLVVLAYARGVLRQHVLLSSLSSEGYGGGGAVGEGGVDSAENPFRVGREEGRGWKGRLGRLMTAFPNAYWLGRDPEDEEWVRGAGERFKAAKLKVPQPAGVKERERRARSGTGPPPAPVRTQSQNKTSA